MKILHGMPGELAFAITNVTSQHIIVPGGGAFFAEGVYADAMFAYSFVSMLGLASAF